jgi:hypothetical protein
MYIRAMETTGRRLPRGAAADEGQEGPGRSVAEARRVIAIVRAVVAAAAVAVVASALINDFWPDDDINGPGPSGRERFVRFLEAVYLPMLVVATVLAISVFAAIYVERLQLDLRRADDERNASAIGRSAPERAPAERTAGERTAAERAAAERAAAERSSTGPSSSNGDQPHGVRGSDAATDDAIWRPSST